MHCSNTENTRSSSTSEELLNQEIKECKMFNEIADTHHTNSTFTDSNEEIYIQDTEDCNTKESSDIGYHTFNNTLTDRKSVV